MELCRGLVVILAIFGGYDRIRQPMHVRKITAENVCFFMFMDNASLTELAKYHIKPDESHIIGIWHIDFVRVSIQGIYNEWPHTQISSS